PMTAQVETVRQSTSVLAKSQIARRQATTAIRMQALVVQNAIFVTTRGLTNPRFIGSRQLHFGLLGTMIRSARTAPYSVEAVMRKGSRRASSPTQMRTCILSGCGSSVVSVNIIAGIF